MNKGSLKQWIDIIGVSSSEMCAQLNMDYSEHAMKKSSFPSGT